VQHSAALHSKDAQVLCMKKRLERCGVALNPTTIQNSRHLIPEFTH
jgi:hypothetical protein